LLCSDFYTKHRAPHRGTSLGSCVCVCVARAGSLCSFKWPLYYQQGPLPPSRESIASPISTFTSSTQYPKSLAQRPPRTSKTHDVVALGRAAFALAAPAFASAAAAAAAAAVGRGWRRSTVGRRVERRGAVRRLAARTTRLLGVFCERCVAAAAAPLVRMQSSFKAFSLYD